MRLLFAYLYCNLGGVTSVLKQRLPYMKRAGWAVDAIFEQDFGGIDDLRSHGVKNVFIRRKDFCSQVARLSEGSDYSVITVVDAPGALDAINALGKRKTIYEVHTPLERSLGDRNGDRLSECTYCIVPSDWSKRWLSSLVRGLSSEKIFVLPNIVDESVFRYPENSIATDGRRPIVLWVGKLVKYKRWKDSLRILSEVSKCRPIAPMLVTGGGELRPDMAIEFLGELRDCGLAGRARWLHNASLSQVASLYRDAASSGGLLLSTSEAESFCMVIHEAIRSGLPVISSAVGPIPDLLSASASECLFALGHPMAAVDLIVRGLDDRSHHERLRDAQRSALRWLQPDAFMARYLALLETVATGQERPDPHIQAGTGWAVA